MSLRPVPYRRRYQQQAKQKAETSQHSLQSALVAYLATQVKQPYLRVLLGIQGRAEAKRGLEVFLRVDLLLREQEFLGLFTALP